MQIIFRDFPLPFHNNAQGASEAAQCAHEQGKFWAYHDLLFENQRALTLDQLKEHAAKVELDTEQFNTCLDSGKYTADVNRDHQEGESLGVSGTPAFFINGRFISGAQPYEKFQQIIEEELQFSGGS